MSNKHQVRDNKINTFLAALAKGSIIAKAVEIAGTNRSQIYLWRRDVPGVAERWDEAISDGLDHLEDVVMKHTDEDWRAAVELLKARNPAKWRTAPMPPPQQPSVQVNLVFAEAEGAVERFRQKIDTTIARRRAQHPGIELLEDPKAQEIIEDLRRRLKEATAAQLPDNPSLSTNGGQRPGTNGGRAPDANGGKR
jgi:hypothetical protein